MILISAITATAWAPDFKKSALALCVLATAVASGWWLPSQYGLGALLIPVLAAVALAVVLSPALGVTLLVATIPLENIFVLEGVLGAQVTWVRALALVVFASWVLNQLIRRESWAPVLAANFLKPAVAFVLLAIASIFWAQQFPGIWKLLTLVQLLVLSLMVVGVVNTWQRLEWVVRFATLGSLITSVLTLFQSFDQGLRRAGVDISGGVNQTGAILVLLLPFGFYLLRRSSSWTWRLVGLVSVTLAPLAILVTFSRTAYIFLALMLGIQLWEMAKSRNKDRILMTVIGLTVGAVMFVSAPWDRVLERADTISPAVQGARGVDNELGSSRMHFWLGAVAIFNDHPLLGVGYENFGYQFLDYQFSVSAKYFNRIYVTSKSPHSSFFGRLAELGSVGTFLWFLLLTVAFLDIRKGWVSSSQAGDDPREVLVKAVFYSLLVYVMFGFFTITHTDKLLWVLLALSAVLRRLSSCADQAHIPVSIRHRGQWVRGD